MINYKQFREHVVIPVLKDLDAEIPYSEEAVDLLMMTAAHESRGGEFLVQQGGPALGVYQMEPATYQDIWDNYLEYRRGLEVEVSSFIDAGGEYAGLLVTNLAYATAMARVHYYRVPEKLPSKDSTNYIHELSEYCKKHWNTELGKATPAKYRLDFLQWEKG